MFWAQNDGGAVMAARGSGIAITTDRPTRVPLSPPDWARKLDGGPTGFDHSAANQQRR